jgi:hypothetical protein
MNEKDRDREFDEMKEQLNELCEGQKGIAESLVALENRMLLRDRGNLNCSPPFVTMDPSRLDPSTERAWAYVP